jgi:hypothetical protein
MRPPSVLSCIPIIISDANAVSYLQTFEIEKGSARRTVSRMIFNKEISGAWEHEPSETLVLHKVDPSSLQIITQQVAEKVAMLVESNERMLDPLVNVYGKRQAASSTPPLLHIILVFSSVCLRCNLTLLITPIPSQASRMTSGDRGLKGTRETGGRGPATKAAPSDLVYLTRRKGEEEAEEGGEEVEATVVVEDGATKKEEEEANDPISPDNPIKEEAKVPGVTIRPGGSWAGVPIPPTTRDRKHPPNTLTFRESFCFTLTTSFCELLISF